MIIEELLSCPKCQAMLQFGSDVLSCVGCGQHYPIVDGIPRLIPGSISTATRRTFDHKWRLYQDGSHPLWGNWIDGKYSEISYENPVTEHTYEKWRQFLLDTLKITENFFEGKRVLDAGCGVGWASYTIARLGANVVATDLADSSVMLAYKILVGLGNSKVIQADLTQLPFKKEFFDTVVSFGVLHHTPKTRSTFLNLTNTVKKGGDFFIHLYEKSHPVRENLTEVVRKIIHIFPEDKQFELCKRFLTVDFDLLKNKPLKQKFFRLLYRSVMLAKTPEEAFDAYSPRYNHRHTFNEVKSWYEEAGFTDITSVIPPIQNSPKKNFYGGALWMRGTRKK